MSAIRPAPGVAARPTRLDGARLSATRRPFSLLPAFSLMVGACADGPPDPLPIDVAAHRAEIDAWHARRVGELEAPDSWLALIGLHWLPQGESTVGGAPDNDVVLPADKAPARLGRVVVDGEHVRWLTEPGVTVTRGVDSTLSLPAATGPRPPDVSGDPAISEALLTDEIGPGKSVVLRHGPLNWISMRRGDRVALRVRDNEDETYAAFQGIDRYPVDPAWRVTARWVPHQKTIAVPNVLGTVSETESPARLDFWIDGAPYSLDLTGDADDERFMIVFADSTSGRETYGGGRYVWVGRPDEQGRVAIDFNLAYNPPCVWSEFATCPLPSRDNRLALTVSAGEKDWKH